MINYRADDVRRSHPVLVQLAEHAPEHLQVVDFDGHINGGKLLFGITPAGNSQHVYLLVGENRGDIT